MARTQGDVTVTLSVLDRLIDREPKTASEAPLTRSQSVRLMKAAVQRDLEWLLNSRRIFIDPDESLKELNRSVYVYGLPDFSSYGAASAPDRAKLLRQLMAAIKMFEPRLLNVRLVPIESEGGGIQELRFRIEGLLAMDPAPEPVSFDTVVELRSSNCRVSGGPNA
ncbi:MAG TPA: type VI secretion system baseplate subunit TssE [Candidatus Acidoferrales bacterium]|jgi:type VI secretion system protein ImpF|nr:type VI secretion system baseplate subunit TssE [Candidatus Acidoferrales bacterium]